MPCIGDRKKACRTSVPCHSAERPRLLSKSSHDRLPACLPLHKRPTTHNANATQYKRKRKRRCARVSRRARPFFLLSVGSVVFCLYGPLACRVLRPEDPKTQDSPCSRAPRLKTHLTRELQDSRLTFPACNGCLYQGVVSSRAYCAARRITALGRLGDAWGRSGTLGMARGRWGRWGR